jgi:hypothetical protein
MRGAQAPSLSSILIPPSRPHGEALNGAFRLALTGKAHRQFVPVADFRPDGSPQLRLIPAAT